MEIYLTGRHERTKVSNAYSSWSELKQDSRKDQSQEHLSLISFGMIYRPDYFAES